MWQKTKSVAEHTSLRRKKTQTYLYPGLIENSNSNHMKSKKTLPTPSVHGWRMSYIRKTPATAHPTVILVPLSSTEYTAALITWA